MRVILFFQNNSGPGKLLGVDLYIQFKVRYYLICLLPNKGGMIYVILKDILCTLDDLNIFPWVDELKPFLSLDGHVL